MMDLFWKSSGIDLFTIIMFTIFYLRDIHSFAY